MAEVGAVSRASIGLPMPGERGPLIAPQIARRSWPQSTGRPQRCPPPAGEKFEILETLHIGCYAAIPAHMLWSYRGSAAGGAGAELAFAGCLGHDLGRIPPPFLASVTDVHGRGVRREAERAG